MILKIESNLMTAILNIKNLFDFVFLCDILVIVGKGGGIMTKDEKLDSVSDGGIREYKKLDSVSGGGIRKYEELVRNLLQRNCQITEIRKILILEKDSVLRKYPKPIRECFTNGSSGTGYDKIQYEINAIDTVISRLDEGVYPRRSWRII